MGDLFEYEEVMIAGWDTLEGQLQRGRGLGYLRALEGEPGVVHEILERCITHDPRWDHQVEVRDDYYARLVVKTGMRLVELNAYLREIRNDRRPWGTNMTLSVLVRLAEFGRADAVDVLRDYIGYGESWDYGLQLLVEAVPEEALKGVPQEICGRFSDGAALEESATYGIGGDFWGGVWERWAVEHPCIRKLIDEVRELEEERQRKHPHQKIDKVTFHGMSVGELLAVADAGNYWRGKIGERIKANVKSRDEAILITGLEGENPFAWLGAFVGLARIGKEEKWREYVFEKAIARLRSLPEGPGRHIHERRALIQLFQLLPEKLTLPLAREWLNSANWHLETLAEDVLEEKATLEDVPLVVSALRDVIDAADPAGRDDKSGGVNSYRACGLLDIMARFEGIGRVPEVELVFVEAEYSMARERAARAMLANAPEWFAEGYAVECLWDCQEETRALGCEGVGLDDVRVVDRLREIAGDEFEGEQLRELARKRIDEWQLM
jgi:hypothetical protein